MCGIAGAFGWGAVQTDEQVLRRMTDAIAHRGPDGEGHVVDERIALGHRRLSIIDLSPAASQPMPNETGDVFVVHNGEIYNFPELRAELESLGHTFRSRSDTEVVVHGYEEWGDRCVERFNGMFAFVVYDRRQGIDGARLLMARDRFGVKPLYYYAADGVVLFASEIKALLQHPSVSVKVSDRALSEYFAFQNIFSDVTLFDGIRLLPAATSMTIDPRRPEPVQQCGYWDYRFAGNFALSAGDASECLYETFSRAVRRQVVADVPIGSYLSGGIDSGSITAVAARSIPRIRTFTGGFDLSSASGMELGFDERRASEMMANLFKTEHYEIVLHAGDMEHVLPTLIWHLEDLRVGQCYPNYYVARLASRFVKVVLSGAGGDELFAGYPWRYLREVPNGDADGYVSAYYRYWQRLLPDEDRSSFFNESTWRRLVHYSPLDVFRGVFGGEAPAVKNVEDVINASLYFELKTFLHGLLLVEDKLSMAHGLETRVPFLDNDLVDLALAIPPHMKLRDLERAPHVDEDEPMKIGRYDRGRTADGKIILRDAMRRLIPEDVAARAKQGFSAPDASWFRGESIDYVNTLLKSADARMYQFFDRRYVARMLDEHSNGQVNHRLLIWSLLSFEWWLRTFC